MSANWETGGNVLERQHSGCRRLPGGCFGPSIANASPFAPTAHLARRMERTRDSFYEPRFQCSADGGGPALSGSDETVELPDLGVASSAARSSEVEVRWCAGSIHVSLALPGLRREDLRIEVGEDAITISGEGGLHRTIPLPKGANVEAAKAGMRAGILEITIPLLQSRPQKRIDVELY